MSFSSGQKQRALQLFNETKLNILHRCFELGENVQLVSEETGYSRAFIYKWRRQYIKEGRLALMNQKRYSQRQLKRRFPRSTTRRVGCIEAKNA